MEYQTSTPQDSSSGPRNPRLKYRRDIPEEIIMRILTRIPAKDLLRFKTVCTPWYSLISTSHFVKTHLAHAARAYQEIIFEVDERDTCEDSNQVVNYISMNLGDQTIQPEVPLALDAFCLEKEKETIGLTICDSCDGLLIFDNPLSVYNPVTRKSKDLPPHSDFVGDCVTLVYDNSIQMYKVFALEYFRTKGFFFTLGRDDSLWRELPGSLFPDVPDQTCVIASNFLRVGCELYWVMKVSAALDDDDKEEIKVHFFTMDVREEKFKKTGFPIRKANSLEGRGEIYLSELKGAICLTIIFHDELNIQMLEKTDNTCRWSTLYNVKFDALSPKPDVLRTFLSEDRSINAFCVPSSNSDNVLDLIKVFIQHDGNLLFYDWKTNDLHQIRSAWSGRHYDPYVFHVNSLVSWE